MNKLYILSLFTVAALSLSFVSNVMADNSPLKGRWSGRLSTTKTCPGIDAVQSVRYSIDTVYEEILAVHEGADASGSYRNSLLYFGYINSSGKSMTADRATGLSGCWVDETLKFRNAANNLAEVSLRYDVDCFQQPVCTTTLSGTLRRSSTTPIVVLP